MSAADGPALHYADTPAVAEDRGRPGNDAPGAADRLQDDPSDSEADPDEDPDDGGGDADADHANGDDDRQPDSDELPEDIARYEGLKDKLLDPSEPDSTRGLDLGDLLRATAESPYARRLVVERILSPTLSEPLLRSLLQAFAQVASRDAAQLRDDYLAPLLRIRFARTALAGVVDDVLASYAAERLRSALVGMFASADNAKAQRAVRFAASGPRLNRREQLPLISPLVDLLASDPTRALRLSVVRALERITAHELGDDLEAWSVLRADFAELDELDQLVRIDQALQARFDALYQRFSAAQVEARVTAVGEMAGDFPALRGALQEATSAADPIASHPQVVSRILELIAEIDVPEDVAEALRDELVPLLALPDPNVRRRVAPPLLALPGGEAFLREQVAREVHPQVTVYLIELLARSGGDVATLEMLLAIVGQHPRPPMPVLRAAVSGLGVWREISEESAASIQQTLELLLEDLDQRRDAGEPADLELTAGLVNALSYLAQRANTWPTVQLALTLSDLMSIRQRLVVLRDALAPASLARDFVAAAYPDWEHANGFLLGVLSSDQSAPSNLQLAAQVVANLGEPFVDENGDVGELHVWLVRRLRTPPPGANGTLAEAILAAWSAMATCRDPYVAEALVLWWMRQGLAERLMTSVLPAIDRHSAEAGGAWTSQEARLSVLRSRVALRTLEGWDSADGILAYASLVTEGALTDDAMVEDLGYAFQYPQRDIPDGLGPRLFAVTQAAAPREVLYVALAALFDDVLDQGGVGPEDTPGTSAPARFVARRIQELDDNPLVDLTAAFDWVARLASLRDRARDDLSRWEAWVGSQWRERVADVATGATELPAALLAFAERGERHRIITVAILDALDTRGVADTLSPLLYGLLADLCATKGLRDRDRFATFPDTPDDLAAIVAELRRALDELYG